MPTIKATIGASDANSYVTLAEAETFFSARLNSDGWELASDSDKEKALLTACRHIEACRIRIHRRPYGYLAQQYDPVAPYEDDQALSFPRAGDRNAAGSIIVPQPVKDAQCEEALAILARGSEADRRAALQTAGVSSFSVDGLSESYERPGATQPVISAEARNLLAPYIERGGVIATSGYPSGTWSEGTLGS